MIKSVNTSKYYHLFSAGFHIKPTTISKEKVCILKTALQFIHTFYEEETDHFAVKLIRCWFSFKVMMITYCLQKRVLKQQYLVLATVSMRQRLQARARYPCSNNSRNTRFVNNNEILMEIIIVVPNYHLLTSIQVVVPGHSIRQLYVCTTSKCTRLRLPTQRVSLKAKKWGGKEPQGKRGRKKGKVERIPIPDSEYPFNGSPCRAAKAQGSKKLFGGMSTR